MDAGRKQVAARGVFRCHVIGPRDAGKTSFCQGILGRTRQDLVGLRREDIPRHTISTVQVYGQDKYLVLEDVDVRNATDALMPSEVQCDACCLLYDVANPRSFEFGCQDLPQVLRGLPRARAGGGEQVRDAGRSPGLHLAARGFLQEAPPAAAAARVGRQRRPERRIR